MRVRGGTVGEAAPPRTARRWNPGPLNSLAALLALAGLLIFGYPSAAGWISSYQQSKLIREYAAEVERANPSAAEQLRMAREYNDALSAGVELEANAHVPTGTGSSSDGALDYRKILAADPDGLMARIRIPSIDVDLPVYHGTEDDTLLRGAGHLEGSHLPIGGPGTHAVITAHRGLASATMFTHLDRVGIGDTFTIEVFGEVLTYRVRETRVVDPDDTDTLRPMEGEDLVTLVTCTPLGINTQRILVTGERISPTPRRDVERAGRASDVPGFPWWIVGGAAGVTVIGGYVYWSGLPPRPAASRSRKP